MTSPLIFGKKIWDSMFLVALGYPENPSYDDVLKYKTYYLLQGNVLPCKKCCFNFNNHIQKYPLDNNVLTSRNNLIIWLFTLRNEVNKMLGKNPINKEDLKNYLYELTTPVQNYSQQINYLMLLIIVLLIVLVTYLLRKK